MAWSLGGVHLGRNAARKSELRIRGRAVPGHAELQDDQIQVEAAVAVRVHGAGLEAEPAREH